MPHKSFLVRRAWRFVRITVISPSCPQLALALTWTSRLWKSFFNVILILFSAFKNVGYEQKKDSRC